MAAAPAAALRADEDASEAADERLDRDTEESVDLADEMVGRRRSFSSRSVAEGHAGDG